MALTCTNLEARRSDTETLAADSLSPATAYFLVRVVQRITQRRRTRPKQWVVTGGNSLLPQNKKSVPRVSSKSEQASTNVSHEGGANGMLGPQVAGRTRYSSSNQHKECYSREAKETIKLEKCRCQGRVSPAEVTAVFRSTTKTLEKCSTASRMSVTSLYPWLAHFSADVPQGYAAPWRCQITRYRRRTVLTPDSTKR